MNDEEREKQRKFKVNFEIEKGANAARLRGEKRDAIEEAKRKKATASQKPAAPQQSSGGFRDFIGGIFPQQRSSGRRGRSRSSAPAGPITWNPNSANPLDPIHSAPRRKKRRRKQSKSGGDNFNPLEGIPDHMRWMF